MKTLNMAGAAIAALLVAGCETPWIVAGAKERQKMLEPLADGEQVAETEYPVPGGSLPEMVRFAVDNRPSMVSAALAVSDARLALKEIDANAPLASRTPWNAIGVDASIGHSESSSQAHFKDLRSKTDGKGSGSLSVDVLIYDFGRNRASARAQAERVVAAELALVEEGYAVFDQVASSYFSRLEAEALLEVAFTNEHMCVEHLARAEGRQREGEAHRLDVLRARLDLAEAREVVVSASNDFVTAGADLAASIGLEAARGQAILPYAAGRGSAGPVRVFADTTGTADALFELARTNAPNMKICRARLRAASADVDYAVADLMPSFSASFSLNWTDPLWYWRWGVNAAQSLFTGFRRTAAVERAVVAMDAAAAAVDAAELELSFNIAKAVAERDNAREAFATAEASVKSARENLETVAGQLMVGDASRIEYTDAVADFTSALANREKAFYRGQIAEAKLFSLVGMEPEYVGAEEDGQR